jgi:hypothetical protein
MRASMLRLSLDNLPSSVHEEVDNESVLWALSNRPCLVEGRFLDAVFAHRTPALVIRLHAADTARLERGRARSPTFGLSDLQRSDEGDARFRARMFACRVPIVPLRTIDTTNLTVEECSECVRLIIEERLAGPA